jgi:hypothetical protein
MDEELQSIDMILEVMSQPNPGSLKANITDEDREGFKKLMGLSVKEKYQGMKEAIARYIVRPQSNAFGIEGFWLIMKLMEVKMKIDQHPDKPEVAFKFKEPKSSTKATPDNPFKFN